jgi:hypothetical protein
MKNRRLAAVAVAFVGLLLSQAVRGDSLADRAPADAIGFVSWAGSDALGKSYNNSHLKGLVETFKVPELIAQSIDKKASQETDPDKKAQQQAAKDMILTVTRSPTAVYVGPMDLSDSEAPKLKIAIYSQVGKEKAAAFATTVSGWIQKEKKAGPPVAALAAGDYLLLTIGDVPEMEKRLAGPAPADGLANLPAFQQTMTQIGAATAPSALLMYMNGQQALKVIGDAITAKGGPEAAIVPQVLEAFGANAVRDYGFAGNFDGANWTSHMFIGFAEKRTGLMSAMLDARHLPDDAVKMIPKNATWASVVRLDGPKLLDGIRDLVDKVTPGGAANFDQGLQQFFAFTGVDLRKDIVDTLGDAFVFYGAPDAKGNTFKAATIANKLKDPQKLETALTTLESVVAAMMGQRGVNTVTFKTESLAPPNDKVSAHVISAGPVAPAWTVQDGVLYLSFSLDGIQRSIGNAGKNSPIFENEQFSALWKKVGNKEMAGFSFIDYPKVVAEAYPIIAKLLKDNPNNALPFELPPLEKINENLGPALSVQWSDKDGYHCKSTGPAPVLDLLRGESIMQYGLMLQVMTNRAEEAPMP